MKRLTIRKRRQAYKPRVGAVPQKYFVAGSGMAGFGDPNMIRTRKLTEHFYLCGDGCSDVADGVGLVASRVMICAAHQAHTILRILAKEQ